MTDAASSFLRVTPFNFTIARDENCQCPCFIIEETETHKNYVNFLKLQVVGGRARDETLAGLAPVGWDSGPLH